MIRLKIQIDYDLLRELIDELDTTFKDMNNILYSIQDLNKDICSSSTWDSEAKRYYQNKCKDLADNFSVVKAHTTDMLTYLSGVQVNIKTTEDNLEKSFSAFGG